MVRGYIEVAARKEFVVGMQAELRRLCRCAGTNRVGGMNSYVFTRSRQPKRPTCYANLKTQD